MKSLGILLAAVAVFVFAVAAQDAGAVERPNVLVIRTDDQAFWALGFNGNKDIHTPNLDRLFGEGASFTNAFVTTTVCSPSRAGFLTGLHSFQVGIPDWIQPKDREHGLGGRFTTLPEVFRRAGYQTAHFGKWHLGFRPEDHPTRNGFESFFGFIEGGQKPLGPTLERDGQTVEFKDQYLEDVLTDGLIEKIEKRDATRPFFFMIDHRAPHTPYAPAPPQDAAQYDGADVAVPAVEGYPVAELKEKRRNYYAAVTSVDRNVGRVLERLDALGLAANTIVLFTSDHGYMIGEHGLIHKGNATSLAGEEAGLKDPEVRRPNMFDNSLRTPLAVRWPGHIKAGLSIDRPVLQIDMFPTLVALAGLEMPVTLEGDGKPWLEGRDASPFLFGHSCLWRIAIFGDYDMEQGKRARMRMVRTADWKLILHEAEVGGANELYDLKNDPGELRNLFGKPEAASAQGPLETSLRNWREQMQDPTLNP